MFLSQIPTREDIESAHDLIRPYIHRTPVLRSDQLDAWAGASLFFKCENQQKIKAFKARGGMHAVLRLSSEDRAKGLVTHSSGNHAQAIALAAKQVGTQAFIVMPSNAPKVKVAGVEALGGQVIFCEPTLEARVSTVEQVQAATGATFIHPFDDYDVIAGQATTAKELIEDCPGLDLVMAPVGGGGLLSGTALSVHYFHPTAHIIAGEPEGAADAVLSFRSGRVEKAPYIQTVADGLLTTLSERTLEIIQRYVNDIWLVQDSEILEAMERVYEGIGQLIEPSCAVPLAAFKRHGQAYHGKKVGVILTGGNVDPDKVPFSIQ